LLHTYPSNAHETQWDVHDPTTDIAAMKSLFPAVIAAADALKTDPALVSEMRAALKKLPAFPHKRAGNGDAVIGMSYDENAPIHNSENIGLEVVWPYALAGDSGPLHDIAVATYERRPNKYQNDWSFDPIHAARLGLAEEFKRALVNLTEKYQEYPSGLAKFVGPEFYVEQVGVVAAGLQEALVQDYDGLLRIAPAWPKEWDADSMIYIQHKSKVDVQVRAGAPVAVVIEAGANAKLAVRNPWPGERVEAVSSASGRRIAGGTAVPVLQFDTEAGKSYFIQRVDHPNTSLRFEAIDGSPAAGPKSLGSRQIGLP
jgi:hypothetical protein